MKDNPWLGTSLALAVALLLVVACFSDSEKETDQITNPWVQQPLYAQQPAYASPPQLAALVQPYTGSKRTPGSVQIPELGMEVAPTPSGQLFVTRVYGGSHADKGNIRSGDRIVMFNSVKVSSPNSFYHAVSAANPEMLVHLHVMRSGRVVGLDCIIGKRELDGVIVPPDAASPHPFAIPG